MEALADFAGACVGVGFDSWTGEMMFPRHASTDEVKREVNSLYYTLFPSELSTTTGSEGYIHLLEGKAAYKPEHAKTIQEAFAKIEGQGSYQNIDATQTKANLATLFRNKVNPLGRNLIRLDKIVDHKIQKRINVFRKNGGVLSDIQTKELNDLKILKRQVNKLRMHVSNVQTTFRKLDYSHQIFTSGDRFRRNGLDALHSVARFYSRHRVVIVSAVTTALILSTIVAFIDRHHKKQHST